MAVSNFVRATIFWVSLMVILAMSFAFMPLWATGLSIVCCYGISQVTA